MAESMEHVTKEAAESAEVARRSVEIAQKGAGVVRNTISSMDNIREQIQETSKRIKRLGESSQEIGDIVELLSDGQEFGLPLGEGLCGARGVATRACDEAIGDKVRSVPPALLAEEHQSG